jgi:NAD(P)-dependent dehydrogenase (short-subunit alcohol dehydrogenase family)
MPYSENAHRPAIASLLSSFSAVRNGFGNFVIPILPALRLPTADLRGKQVIVTGANSGIGFETAKALVGMGARVILACRNAERGEQARKCIVEAALSGEVEVEALDCAKFESVRAFLRRWETREVKQVDILINNAGEWALIIILRLPLTFAFLKVGYSILSLKLRMALKMPTSPITWRMSSSHSPS